MCGINGFNFRDEGLIDSMVRSTAHRGPDDSGIYLDDNVSLGHNRLSIIDLSKRGHQPMISADGRKVIVYNGELYNYREIKKDLEDRGRKFRSDSDTEVVLQAHEEYGQACLDEFNGIFAFAVWDKEKKELFLARDQFGVKPLFYYWDGKKFIFSSEIKGILEHNVKREINLVALNTYFRLLYIPGPETIWENIYKLQPAHYLVIKRNEIEIKKYWEISDFSNIADKESIKKEMRRLLKNSVKRQLVADVPVGVFLSGGMDSTIVLGLMSKFASKKIKTFSVGFEVSKGSYDRINEDYLTAEKTAKYYNTDHYGIFINDKDVAENLEKTAWHMDDLVYSATQVSNLILAQLAKKEVKVVLGGDGGDELFGGYNRYYYYRMAELWQHIPEALRKNKPLENLFKLAGKKEVYNKINLDEFGLFWSFQQKEELLKCALNPEFNDLENSKDYVRRVSGLGNRYIKGDEAKKIMKLDLDMWLVDFSLVRSDKMGMAVGLEERVPILDKELASLAMRIPTKYKINKAEQGKKIWKEAFNDYLPDFVFNKKKSGWFTPTGKWLRRGLKEMAYQIISPGYVSGTEQYINFTETRKILDGHISGEGYALNTLWSIINFQVWYKQFLKS